MDRLMLIVGLSPQPSTVLGVFFLGCLVGYSLCGVTYRRKIVRLKRELKQLKVTSIQQELMYDRLPSLLHVADSHGDGEASLDSCLDTQHPHDTIESEFASDRSSTEDLLEIQQQIEEAQSEVQRAHRQLSQLTEELGQLRTNAPTELVNQADRETLTAEQLAVVRETANSATH